MNRAGARPALLTLLFFAISSMSMTACGEDPPVETITDTTAPIVGTGISFSNTTSSSTHVAWDAATDDASAPEDLEYKVVTSRLTAAAIDTVEEADLVVGAGLLRDWSLALTQLDASSLMPQTNYHVAVLVRDEAGNRSLIGPATVTTAATPSAAKSISSFSFAAIGAGVIGTINEPQHTISLTVPASTNVTNLVATFTASPGATVRVGATPQVSGTTANNFTLPVVYTVQAANGTTQDYIVTVTVPVLSSAKDFLTFAFTSFNPDAVGTLDNVAHTIGVFVPNGSDVMNLAATFTVSQGASVRVGAAPQTSGTTTHDFTTPVTYTVVAEDGSTQDYTVTVTIGLSTNARLASLSASMLNGVLSPAFDPDTTSYTATTFVGAVRVTPTAQDPGATITVNGTAVLSGADTNPIAITHAGPNNISIVVTAPDGTTTRTYTIAVTHQYPTIAINSDVAPAEADENWSVVSSYIEEPDALAGPDISMVRVTNDATYLYVAVYLHGGANKDWNNAVFLLLDSDGDGGGTSGATNFTANPPLPWGNKNFTTSMAVDAALFCYGDETGRAVWSFVDNATAGTNDNGAGGALIDYNVDFNGTPAEPFYLEARFELADLGLTPGEVVRIIALENDWDGASNDEVSDVLPSSSAALDMGNANDSVLDNYITYRVL